MNIQSLQSLLPLLARLAGALSLGWAVYALLSLGRRSATRTLADFLAEGDAIIGDDPAAAMGTAAYKVRLAFRSLGIEVTPGHETAYRWALVALSSVLLLAVSWAWLPPVALLTIPLAMIFIVDGWIAGRWAKERQRIEAELPTLLTRLASVLQVNENLMQSLDDVVASLEPNGPLQRWMRRMLRLVQQQGQGAFKAVKAEAEVISPSLYLAVMEIERTWATGGTGYTQAFQMSADNLAAILDSRAEAQAIAAGAWGTVRIIILALGAAFVMVLQQPHGRAMLSTPIVQVGLFLVVLWGLVGYWVIQGQIAEVAE